MVLTNRRITYRAVVDRMSPPTHDVQYVIGSVYVAVDAV